ncbi:Asp-tRNA(Asn)/Glu-tRNA(Gln) amidotransferase subunit GatA [Candidatus Woesearchaeota archaeon]|nr:Asp-tRNA(Asn)/Glu-tRNA(Gln) amidotransferase subunit GatA [Candidatus Woesearchaeota archaeon]
MAASFSSLPSSLLSDTLDRFRRGDLSVEEHTAKVLEEAEKINKDYFYYNTVSSDLAMSQARELDQQHKRGKASGRLFGIPMSVKDSICVKGVESTAGSRILKGYFPLFNATVVQRAVNEGAVVIGKTAQDEFGFGAFAVNVGLGYAIPRNPLDKKRTTGGSSGGCVGITSKTSYAHVSLAESTGGSIVEPAAFCSVVGLCPTYSRVSRYGLIDFSNTFDKIGPAAKTVQDAALLLDVISGHDPQDSTSHPSPASSSLPPSSSHSSSVASFTSFVGKDIAGMKIGVIKEAFGAGVSEVVAKSVRQGIARLEQHGAVVDEISLESPIKYSIPTYYIIATSEASTNLAKYCGMRYGNHEPLDGNFNAYFTKVRSANFGEEAKRRIMLGTFARMAGFRDAFYLQALKVREKIVQDYKGVFKRYDALVSPTVGIQPPTFEEIEKLTPLQHYMMDVLYLGPNIAGLPHLNIPLPLANGLPVGLMLVGDHFAEGKLVQLGSALEEKKR